jgi:hypothetical protein
MVAFDQIIFNNIQGWSRQCQAMEVLFVILTNSQPISHLRFLDENMKNDYGKQKLIIRKID